MPFGSGAALSVYGLHLMITLQTEDQIGSGGVVCPEAAPTPVSRRSMNPVRPTSRLPWVSETGPMSGAVIPQDTLITAANCPVTATEVWNAAASSTNSGPSISAAVLTKNTAADRRLKSQVEEARRFTMPTFSLRGTVLKGQRKPFRYSYGRPSSFLLLTREDP